MRKMVRWIGEGLRKLYPVKVTKDPIAAITFDAMQLNRSVRRANQQAAQDSIVAMSTWLSERSVDQRRPAPYI